MPRLVLVIPTNEHGYELLRAGAATWRRRVPAVIVTEGGAEAPSLPYGSLNASDAPDARLHSVPTPSAPGTGEAWLAAEQPPISWWAHSKDWEPGVAGGQELWYTHPREGSGPNRGARQAAAALRIAHEALTAHAEATIPDEHGRRENAYEWLALGDDDTMFFLDSVYKQLEARARARRGAFFVCGGFRRGAGR